MPKLVKIIFILLSIILVSALVLACTTAYKGGSDDESSLPPESSSVSPPAEDSSEEISVDDSSVEVSVDDSSEEISVEDSSEEISEEEPSEEVSTEPTPPPVLDGSTDPITTPPTGVVANDIDAYFNDSLFVGHSVMVHFKNYVSSWRKTVDAGVLGNASFGCSSSFSFYNNANQSTTQADNVLPKYQGQSYKIEDLVTVTGVKTVYLGLMGLNDLGMVGKADTCASLVADEVKACIEAIKEKNPEVQIVVLSSTYLVRGINYPKLNNRNMSLLNSYVLEYCNAEGIDFVDVATPLIDGGGYLAGVYCSDNYCHLKQNAYYVWLDVLRDYAAKKQSGTWQNPESIPLFN